MLNIFRKKVVSPVSYEGVITFLYSDGQGGWGRKLESKVQGATVGEVMDNLASLTLELKDTFRDEPDFISYTYPEYWRGRSYIPTMNEVIYQGSGARWWIREDEDGKVETRIGWLIESLIDDLERKALKAGVRTFPMVSAVEWEKEMKRIIPELQQWWDSGKG